MCYLLINIYTVFSFHVCIDAAVPSTIMVVVIFSKILSVSKITSNLIYTSHIRITIQSPTLDDLELETGVSFGFWSYNLYFFYKYIVF